MPKWLSSMLIIIGFLALVAMALLPRNIEVTVSTNVDDRDVHHNLSATDSLHMPPGEVEIEVEIEEEDAE